MELEDKLKDTTGNITNERSGGDKVHPPRCMIPQKNSYTRLSSLWITLSTDKSDNNIPFQIPFYYFTSPGLDNGSGMLKKHKI